MYCYWCGRPGLEMLEWGARGLRLAAMFRANRDDHLAYFGRMWECMWGVYGGLAGPVECEGGWQKSSLCTLLVRACVCVHRCNQEACMQLKRASPSVCSRLRPAWINGSDFVQAAWRTVSHL